jgi:hypothetical protein
MTDIICPLCGKSNPPELDECMYCQAPLNATGFLAPSDQEGQENPLIFPSGESDQAESQVLKPESSSPLEQAIPDWLKNTEANFLEGTEAKPERQAPDDISEQIDSLLSQTSTPDNITQPAIDDDWLASLLAEAGSEVSPLPSQEEPLDENAEPVNENITQSFVEEPLEEEGGLPPTPVEKPDWLTGLEASSKIKLEGEITPTEALVMGAGVAQTIESVDSGSMDIPDWIGKIEPEETPPALEEPGSQIAPAELPGWLEALRPEENVSATEPVEDLSAADIVAAGPLVGLRGVINAHPSAIRARKPPTYSIKLRVTDEQRARVAMMEALLADEQKPKPLASQPVLTSRNIFRLVIAAALILPIAWMIITGSQQVPTPQPGEVPGVVDFTQEVQALPAGLPVLLAFDYEAGFSGEMNLAVSTLITQLMIKNAFMTMVTTLPSGPALAESLISSSVGAEGNLAPYPYYANLGYIPGGTLGLRGLALSPKSVLPYSLDEVNVWVSAPLDTISTINDFSAVIVLTNDPDTARSWIEQVGPVLRVDGTPLLIVTSSQAEPMIRPYYEASPSQVQGMVSSLVGGLAYGSAVGNIQQNGEWDAFSIAITVSVLIILIGSISRAVLKIPVPGKKKES